jgi:hypothetical protein
MNLEIENFKATTTVDGVDMVSCHTLNHTIFYLNYGMMTDLWYPGPPILRWRSKGPGSNVESRIIGISMLRSEHLFVDSGFLIASYGMKNILWSSP